MQKDLTALVGKFAAIIVAIATTLFGILTVLDLLVPSRGGSLAAFAICIVLPLGVVAMMAAVYLRSPPEQRIAGLLALAAALLYAPFCIGVYFVQIAVVALNPLKFSPEVLSLITFLPGSPAFALDMVGYGFLCLSTWAAAFTFTDPRDKVLRLLCIVHGCLVLPTLAGPILSGIFVSPSGQSNSIGSWVLLLWCLIFIPIPLLLTKLFRRQ